MKGIIFGRINIEEDSEGMILQNIRYVKRLGASRTAGCRTDVLISDPEKHRFFRSTKIS